MGELAADAAKIAEAPPGFGSRRFGLQALTYQPLGLLLQMELQLGIDVLLD
jgi:hypothetical protein